jgi:hypothetical protein
LLITDPSALAVVAAAGGDFHHLVPEHSYDSIAVQLASDIDEIRRGDKTAGIGLHRSHRLFDTNWLRDGTYELIAVVSRIDRASFTAGRCGDVRLIYRLRYDLGVGKDRVSSRVPMTAAVVLVGGEREQSASEPTACRNAAQRWRAPASARGADLGKWLVDESGPLHALLAAEKVQMILTNMQAVRWPSSVHPDLGGHAEYVLRAFEPASAGSAVPMSLEAVPDGDRIRAQPKLRDALLAWLRRPETLQALDRGEVMLPVGLRAAKSVSVSPRGLARRGNRPFRSLLEPADLAGLELGSLRRLRSPEAVLRRLDELTCAGCHQTRSLAGFHLLGEDGADVPAGNALAVSLSPHLLADLARRRRIADALAAGQPTAFDFPFVARAPEEEGGPGAACGLGDPGFSEWRCATGLNCITFDARAGDRTIGAARLAASPRNLAGPRSR